MRRGGLWSVTLAISILSIGCSHLPPPTVMGEPLVVNLPFSMAGITDGRQQFAALFSRVLAHTGREPGLGKWLHLTGDLPETGALAVPALPGLSVLVVPGIFGDCVADQALPFSDGVARAVPRNYTEGYRHYQDLGQVRAVQVPGRASSASNATLIARELRAEAERTDVQAIVLVAYSKGVPDTLVALDSLAAQGQLPAKIRALVSVSGVVMGTPIADQNQRLYDVLAASFAPLACSVSAGGEVESLTVRQRRPWLAAHSMPAGVKTYSVVAYTERETIAPGLRSFHDLLNLLDRRNDGQVIAGWSLLPGSKLLAEVRSDHWTYVLALPQHPSALVRAMAAPADFPRDAFFAALLQAVTMDLARPAP